jgi:hypothetical protein
MYIHRKMGVPSAENVHTLWGRGKSISRQSSPCTLLCKEADSNPGYKGRYSTTVPIKHPNTIIIWLNKKRLALFISFDMHARF